MHIVKQYAIWFKDKRNKIIILEGKGYNECVRCLFKALLISTNKEFLNTMKVDKRLWTQKKQVAIYWYKDVLDATETSYNNINAENLWDAPKATSRTRKKDGATDAHILALIANWSSSWAKVLMEIIAPQNKTWVGNIRTSKEKPSAIRWQGMRRHTMSATRNLTSKTLVLPQGMHEQGQLQKEEGPRASE